MMRNLRPDVCHVNLRTPYACQHGLLAAILTPRAHVVAVEHLPLRAGSRLLRWLKRRTSRRLAAHIAVSDSAARAVEEDAGLKTGSIAVIRNGVPAQPDDTARERLVSGSVIGSTGRLDRQKGFDLVIDALPLLPGVTAVLVGDGPERVALEHRAKEADVADRVILTGWTDRVASLLRGFDVFVLASRFEGLPLVILEAMEAGLPVVASSVGGVSEAVADGETGLIVPPEDSVSLAAGVRKLLADEELRRRLGRRGREVWAAEFDAARMAEEYERLYRGLVG
jgi:glycosyltransferase involved in cell wall biosynthesis